MNVLLTFAVCLGLLAPIADKPKTDQTLDETHVKAIALLLPAQPIGLGRPASDRDAWGRLAALPGSQDIVRKAETLLAQPLPEQPDELYLDFSVRNQIQAGIYPAFADCSILARPDENTMFILNQRFALGLEDYAVLDTERLTSSLSIAMLLAFRDAGPRLDVPLRPTSHDLRAYFEDAGILISRPQPGSASRMAVALKGGHNAEHHNHNDVGSYAVVLDARPLLLDPGAETYTAHTFSARRYESKLLNSYGHPVPVVAGKLQRKGGAARGQVLRAEFSDEADTFELDLRSAYDVPELQRLTRRFVYSRQGTGALTITDQVQFDSPQDFSSALITLSPWYQTGPRTLVIYGAEEAIQVELDCAQADLNLVAEVIEEEGSHPTRIGIHLVHPVTAATLELRITPAPELEQEGLLRNSSFEHAARGWDLPPGGMGSVSDEQAVSGDFSLQIVDNDAQRGSSISSARIPLAGQKSFELRGQVYHVSGSGIGMYARYFDAEGRSLNPTSQRGNVAPLASLSGTADAWPPFTIPFRTPPETAHITVWIHSFNLAQVVAYLDDLQIVAVDEP